MKTTWDNKVELNNISAFPKENGRLNKRLLAMILNYLMLTLLGIIITNPLQAQTSLEGKISVKTSEQEIIGATIVVFRNGVRVQETVPDIDGNYKLNLDAGSYDMEFEVLGYERLTISGVVVFAGKINLVDIEFEEMVNQCCFCGGNFLEYKIPLLTKDNTTKGEVIIVDENRRLPTRSISEIASSVAGVSIVNY